MQAAAGFRAMKAVGAVVAPTDTVPAQFWCSNGAVVAQFSRPRHNPHRPSRRLKHQPRVLAHGVEADLLPVFKRRQSPSTPLMTLLTNASSPGWWLDVLVRP